MSDSYAVAMALRLEGKTYAQIASELSVSRQRAQQLLSPHPAAKDIVIARAGGRCQRCATPAGASGHIHHRVAKGVSEDYYNSAENLMLLCTSCHVSVHVAPKKLATYQRRAFDRAEMVRMPRGVRIGAAALGIAASEYLAHIQSGEKWCSWHKAWEPVETFKTATRGICAEANRERSRAHSKAVTARGRTTVGTRPGLAAMRQSATRLGITPDDYAAHIDADEHWCSGHKQWHPNADFTRNVRLPGGLSFYCRAFYQQRYRAAKAVAS